MFRAAPTRPSNRPSNRATSRPLIEAFESRRLMSATVNISALVGNAYRDSGQAGVVVVTRRDDLSTNLTVPLTITGTASNGVDYGRIGTEVTIPAGERSVAIRLRPSDDGGDSEYAAVSVDAVAGYDTSVKTAIVNVLDSKASAAPAVGGVRLTQTADDTFTLTRSGDLSEYLTVPITTGGSAVNGVDYGRVGDAVTFAPNESVITLHLRFTAAGEASGRTATIALAGIPVATPVASPGTAGGAIASTGGTSASTTTTTTTTTGSATGTTTGSGTVIDTGTTTGTSSGATTSTGSGTAINTGTTGTTNNASGTSVASSGSAGTVIDTGSSSSGNISTDTDTSVNNNTSSTTTSGLTTIGSTTTNVPTVDSSSPTGSSSAGDDGIFSSIPVTAPVTNDEGITYVGVVQ